MKVLTASWDGESDKTIIKFSDGFATSNWIVKADVLIDLIAMLNHQYETLMSCEFTIRDEYKLNTLHSSDLV